MENQGKELREKMGKETCEGKEGEERVRGKEGIQGKETVKGKRQFIEKI